MTTEYIDLVMDNGELVRIEVPSKYYDDAHATLEIAMKRGDWWSPHRFDRCKAEYLGLLMGRINMKKVMGML